MLNLTNHFKFIINDKLYNKNPESTDLGKNIIKTSIVLIEEMGYEQFTFKKLGEAINSNESSIYRYFENKHNLLIYLCSWYWLWIDYQIMMGFLNMNPKENRLKIALQYIVGQSTENEQIDYINESKLQNIVIAEFNKTFMTKSVDEENQMGFYLVFKNVIYR